MPVLPTVDILNLISSDVVSGYQSSVARCHFFWTQPLPIVDSGLIMPSSPILWTAVDIMFLPVLRYVHECVYVQWRYFSTSLPSTFIFQR